MSDKSTIEWTEATLNPWTGCTKVSPGCARCYIPRTMPFRTAGRDFDRKGHIPLVFHMERLEKMVRRRKPTMYFVNSLSDLFHEHASDEQIAQVFAAMAAAPQHTFQCLTKRPERMRSLLADLMFESQVEWVARDSYFGGHQVYGLFENMEWPLPNVWLGVTIENRQFVHRADLLRQTPAAVRFISAEPLLGPLIPRSDDGLPYWDDHWEGGGLDLTDIDWLICGGESGKGARRFDLQWARDLRDACLAQWMRGAFEHALQPGQTAFFLKQMGGSRPGNALEDLPEDLQIREFPRQAVRA